MRNFRASKSGLFLMEMILVVLLFALSAAVCLQMFSYASLTADKASDYSSAILAARSAADCYKATQGDLPQVATLLSGTATQNGVTVAYDNQWQPSKEGTAYELTMTTQANVATITLWKVGEVDPIYTLETKIPGGETP